MPSFAVPPPYGASSPYGAPPPYAAPPPYYAYSGEAGSSHGASMAPDLQTDDVAGYFSDLVGGDFDATSTVHRSWVMRHRP